MPKLQGFLIVLLAASLSACDSGPNGSLTQPGKPRLDGSGDPVLTVTMSGPDWFNTPGYYTVTATVTGGSGTYRYHWYSRACWLYGGSVQCNNDYMQDDEGIGLSSSTKYYGEYDVKRDIVVQVQDVGSGSDIPATWMGTWYTENPTNNEPRPSGEYSFNCGKGLNWYPLTRYEGGITTEYYRNPCTGTRVDKPL